ncbi:MAG: LytR family transcriptional regulator, partial [Lachnospiraceae bacterium]|nr:LytR family transcriptional regulator [Lachnospiraceae bacterium]
QRQRLVIEKIVDKAKSKGLSSVTAIIEDVFPKVKTNFSSSQLIKMASQMFHYNIEYTRGFPFAHLETDIGDLDVVVPVTLADNVSELHEFLFDDTGYVVSKNVKEYSDRIEKDSGFGAASRQAAIENGVVPDTGSEADLAK